jgi:septin family protein
MRCRYMMEGISSLVAVVPVIAKADTYTADELQAYRTEIRQVRLRPPLHGQNNDRRYESYAAATALQPHRPTCCRSKQKCGPL